MGADLVANILEIRKDRTPDWEAAERHLMSKRGGSPTRAVLLKALQSVIDCWHGSSRNAIKYEAATTVILIVGGTTVGDPFEEIDDVEAFVASGMARAAGFMVGDDR